MSSEPLVSVCIPAYNAEKWINHTIESVIAQTWRNIEIIIVDDGSTDRTLDIVKSYKSKNLKIITQCNKGACASRNLALSYAQGDYLQWLDSDDILHHQKIENQLINGDFNTDPYILHTCKWGSFYSRLQMARFEENPLWQNLAPIDWLIFHFCEGFFMTPSTWLVSRKLTDSAGPWNENLLKNQDGEYFIRVVMNSKFIKFHGNSISYYRRGNLNSVSNSQSIKSFESLNNANQICINTLLEFNDSEKTRKAAVKFLQRFIDHHHYSDHKIISENKQRILELGGKINLQPKRFSFNLLRNLLGIETATNLKAYIWNFHITFNKNYECLMGKIFNDNI